MLRMDPQLTAACSVCRAKPVARLDYVGLHLCSEHFTQRFESRAIQTILAMGMLQRGERVAAAVSGGKDSLSLLYLLSKYRNQLGIELVAVLIDEGVRGYRPKKVEVARLYAERWRVELAVRSFKDEFGYTLDEAVQKLMMNGLKYKPCTVCGVFRRYLLNKVALELGADKLATAHNLDDEAQAFLLNAIQANFQAMVREGPVNPRAHPKLVPRVKPFYFIPEKEVLTYALLHGIETPDVECPYIVYSSRHILRRWLNKVAQSDPAVKQRVLAVKHLVCKRLQLVKLSEFRTCTVCGMPSSGDMCKACELLQSLRASA